MALARPAQRPGIHAGASSPALSLLVPLGGMEPTGGFSLHFSITSTRLVIVEDTWPVEAKYSLDVGRTLE